MDKKLKKREITKTADGSDTIYIPEWNESYHSKHGAIQEAYHVFIKNGLDLFRNKASVSILELGFGTGLNAIITMFESEIRQQEIDYTGIEKYPVNIEEIQGLNYFEEVFQNYSDLDKNEWYVNWIEMHEFSWSERLKLTDYFYLIKQQLDFFEMNQLENDQFDLVYFDCFGARVQPELWEEKLFKIVYDLMKTKGILTTYSAKGSARRAMESVGFNVERKPGPPGKREMLVATK